MTDRRDSIGIAGAGRVAQALGKLLAEAGQPVAAIAARTHAARAAAFIGSSVEAVELRELPRRAARILIAVSDDAIDTVAAELVDAGMADGTVLHTSGAHGPRLRPFAGGAVACGVLHPLQTIATAENGVTALRGAAWGIAGDPGAMRWAEEIVAAAGGTPLRIQDGGFASYHAGAVMASNAVIAALDSAVVLLGAAGIERSAALRAVGPLCLRSAENAIALGPDAALTGPVQRGDVETVRMHVAALGACPPYVGDLYRASARALVEISRRRGLSDRSAAGIQTVLEG